jgi:hypothetical protein
MSTSASPLLRRAIASWRWWCVNFGLRPMTTPRTFARSLPSVVPRRQCPALTGGFRMFSLAVDRRLPLDGIRLKWSRIQYVKEAEGRMGTKCSVYRQGLSTIRACAGSTHARVE